MGLRDFYRHHPVLVTGGVLLVAVAATGLWVLAPARRVKVDGQVIDADTLGGRTCGLVELTNLDTDEPRGQPTNSEGRFHFEVTQGNYKIRALCSDNSVSDEVRFTLPPEARDLLLRVKTQRAAKEKAPKPDAAR